MKIVDVFNDFILVKPLELSSTFKIEGEEPVRIGEVVKTTNLFLEGEVLLYSHYACPVVEYKGEKFYVVRGEDVIARMSLEG